MADEWISETKVFDLTLLKEMFQDAYQQDSGQVIINLEDQSVTYSF
jgi:hypothetical protein